MNDSEELINAHFDCRSMIRLLCFVIVLPSFACSPSKYIQSESRIHFKNEIHLKGKHQLHNSKKIERDLNKMIKSNPKYGVGKWRLGTYLKLQDTTNNKGFKNWFKNKFGKKPDYFEAYQIESNRIRMQKYMFDHGHFEAYVKTDTLIDKNYVTSVYTIDPGPGYLIEAIEFRQDTGALTNLLQSFRHECILKHGEIYSRDKLLSERNRLLELCVDHGFLDVSKENILFFLDTISIDSKVNIYIRLEFSNENLSINPYLIRDTWVFQNFSLMTKENAIKKDTLYFDGIQFVQDREILRPKVLKRLLSQTQGDIYSESLMNGSINKLLDLGIYKFVNVKTDKSEFSGQNILDRYIYLTPGVIREISTEFRANTRTGNFLGSGVSFGYTNRNLFRGAERLEINLSGSVETQIGNGNTFINTAESGIRLNLLLPYSWPFSLNKSSALYNPKTQTSLAYKYEKRFEFYSLSSLSFQFGYDWRSSKQTRFQFYPIVINQIHLLKTTSKLEDVLLENPSLRNSFEDVFIGGAQFNYTHTNQNPNNKVSVFFKMNLESSGQLIYAVSSILKHQQKPYNILGLPAAQYLKLDADLRYTFNFGSDRLVTRFFSGIGIAFGNSTVLPYVKQYYSGGSSGIRAFPIRTLGPGSYQNPRVDSNENEFIDQTGDFKLEANVEYRFPISGFFKGAFFVDMGNIWVFKDQNDTREGGVLTLNTFLSEIAIGGGFGLRLDINSFVLRLDLAFPLRKPFLPEKQRWVINEINIFEKDWRSENLVWNLGLGYPF